jgi:hypothetical protein
MKSHGVAGGQPQSGCGTKTRVGLRFLQPYAGKEAIAQSTLKGLVPEKTTALFC